MVNTHTEMQIFCTHLLIHVRVYLNEGGGCQNYSIFIYSKLLLPRLLSESTSVNTILFRYHSVENAENA